MLEQLSPPEEDEEKTETGVRHHSTRHPQREAELVSYLGSETEPEPAMPPASETDNRE